MTWNICELTLETEFTITKAIMSEIIFVVFFSYSFLVLNTRNFERKKK